MIAQPDPDDLVRVKKWFERLSEHVRAVDFAGAHPLFADDMIAFGTFENFITGREAAGPNGAMSGRSPLGSASAWTISAPSSRPTG